MVANGSPLGDETFGEEDDIAGAESGVFGTPSSPPQTFSQCAHMLELSIRYSVRALAQLACGQRRIASARAPCGAYTPHCGEPLRDVYWR